MPSAREPLPVTEFFDCIFETDQGQSVHVATPSKVKKVKDLFNEAYGLRRVFTDIKEDPVTVFKSELVAIAAKRRKHKLADKQSLTKSIEANTDPVEIAKAKVKKKLYQPLDIKRLTKQANKDLMELHGPMFYEQYIRSFKRQDDEPIVFNRLTNPSYIKS